MKFLNYTKPRLLVADEGKHIRSKNDVYVAEYVDENGNVVPEHKPYYSTIIFLGSQIQTLEDVEELYIEESEVQKC